MCVCSELREGILYTKFAADIDIRLIQGHFDDVERLCEEITVLKGYIDLSECARIDLADYEIIELLELGRKVFRKIEKSYIAVYAPGAYVYGMGRMVQTFAMFSSKPAEVEIFWDTKEAMRWLAGIGPTL